VGVGDGVGVGLGVGLGVGTGVGVGGVVELIASATVGLGTDWPEVESAAA